MSSYRDRKRTASDLVHRKNRINQKKKEADEPPQLDSIVDSFAASLFGPAPTAAPEPEVNEPEPVAHEPVHQESHAEPEPEYEEPQDEEVGYEDTGYVKDTHTQVAAEAEEEYDETATAVSGEDINYNDIEYEEDQYAIEVTDDEDIEPQYTEEDDSQQLHELHEEAQRVEAERYVAENDAQDANNLASEKLDEQRGAIAQLQQNIEQGRAAIASIREQAQAAYDEAVREFDENNATLQSLVAERDQLVAEYEQTKLELQNRAESQNAHVMGIVEQIGVETQAIETRKAELAQLHGETADEDSVEVRGAELTRLQSEHQELVEAIEHFTNERARLVESQSEELAAIESQVAAETEAIEQSRAELERLQSEAIESGDLEARRTELANLESERTQLVTAIEQARAAFQEQVDAQQAELNALSEQIVAERQKSAEYSQQLAQVQSATVDSGEIEQHRQELSELEMANSQLLVAIEEATVIAEQHREEASAEQEQLEAQLTELRTTVELRRQELEELRAVPVSRIDPELQSEIRTLTDKVAELDHDIHRTKESRQAVDNDVINQEQALVKQRDELKAKIEKATLKLEELQSVDVTEADVENRQNEIQALHGDFFRVKAAIAEAMNDFVARKRAAEDQQAQHTRLVTELTERLEEQNRSLIQLQAEPVPELDAELKAQVDGLTRESSELQQVLETTQRERGEAAYVAEQNRMELLKERDRLLVTLEQQRGELESLRGLTSPEDSEEIARLTDHVAELDQQLVALREESAEAQRLAAEHTEKQQHRIFELRADVELRTEALARMRELAKPEVPVELDAECNGLTEQLAGLEEAIQQANTSREQAALELREQLEARIAALRSEVAVRTDELQELQSQTAPEEPTELVAEVTSLTEQGTELKRQIELIREDRAAEVARIEQLAQELSQKKQELVEQRDALHATVEADRAALNELREQSPASGEEESGLEQQIEQLTAEQNQIEQETLAEEERQAEAERAAAERREQLTAQAAELSEQIAAQLQSLEELRNAPGPSEPTELDEQIQNLTEQSNTIASEIEQLTAKRAAAESAAQQRREELTQQRDALLSSLSGQQEQLTLFQQQDMEEEPEELRTLLTEIESLTAEAARVETTKREENERLEREREQAVASARDRIAKLKAEIDTDREALATLRESTVDSSAVDGLRTEIDQLVQESEKIQAELNSLTEERQAEEQAARESRANLELQRTELAGSLEGHRRTLEALQAESAPEEDGLGILQAEIDSLLQQQTELTASIEAAQSAAESRRAESDANRAELESRVRSLKADLASEQQQLASLKAEEDSPLDEFDIQLAQLNAELVQARSEVQTATERAAEIRASLDRQQQEFENQREELRQQIEAARAELSAVDQPAEMNPADVEIRKAELQTLLQERDQLATELQTAEQTSAARAEAAAAQLEDHRQQVEFLKAGIEANRESLRELAAAEVNSDAEALKLELERLQLQAEAVQSELQEKRHSIAVANAAREQQQQETEQKRAVILEAIRADQAELDEVNAFIANSQGAEDKSDDLDQLTNQRRQIAERLTEARQELANAAQAKAVADNEADRVNKLREAIAADQKEIRSIGKEVQAMREKAAGPDEQLAELMKKRTESLNRLKKAREIHARQVEAERQADERSARDAARLQAEINVVEEETSRLVAPEESKPVPQAKITKKKPTKLAPFEDLAGKPIVSPAKQTKFRKRRSTHPDNLRDPEENDASADE